MPHPDTCHPGDHVAPPRPALLVDHHVHDPIDVSEGGRKTISVRDKRDEFHVGKKTPSESWKEICMIETFNIDNSGYFDPPKDVRQFSNLN